MGFGSVRDWSRNSALLTGLFGRGRVRRIAATLAVAGALLFGALFIVGDFMGLPGVLTSLGGAVEKAYTMLTPSTWLIVLFILIFGAAIEVVYAQVRKIYAAQLAAEQAAAVGRIIDRLPKTILGEPIVEDELSNGTWLAIRSLEMQHVDWQPLKYEQSVDLAFTHQNILPGSFEAQQKNIVIRHSTIWSHLQSLRRELEEKSRLVPPQIMG